MNFCGKSGELHLSIRVGSSFEIEPADSTKAVGDVDLYRSRVSRLSIRAAHSQFQRAGTGSAVHHRKLFVVRLPLSRKKIRKNSSCDEDAAQKTKRPVHIRTIIRGRLATFAPFPTAAAPFAVFKEPAQLGWDEGRANPPKETSGACLEVTSNQLEYYGDIRQLRDPFWTGDHPPVMAPEPPES